MLDKAIYHYSLYMAVIINKFAYIGVYP